MRNKEGTALRRKAGSSVLQHSVWFLRDVVMCISPPLTVPPPPATAGGTTDSKREKTTNSTNRLEVHRCSLRWKICVPNLSTGVRFTRCATYCKRVQSSMTSTQPITHSTITVAMVCCLWLVATTASRSACSHLIPTKPGWHLRHGGECNIAYILELFWK